MVLLPGAPERGADVSPLTSRPLSRLSTQEVDGDGRTRSRRAMTHAHVRRSTDLPGRAQTCADMCAGCLTLNRRHRRPRVRVFSSPRPRPLRHRGHHRARTRVACTETRERHEDSIAPPRTADRLPDLRATSVACTRISSSTAVRLYQHRREVSASLLTREAPGSEQDSAPSHFTPNRASSRTCDALQPHRAILLRPTTWRTFV